MARNEHCRKIIARPYKLSRGKLLLFFKNKKYFKTLIKVISIARPISIIVQNSYPIDTVQLFGPPIKLLSRTMETTVVVVGVVEDAVVLLESVANVNVKWLT